MVNDLIERQAAIEAVCLNNYHDITLVNGKPYTRGYHDGVLAKQNDCIENIMDLPSAEPESTRTFVELVVKYPDPELCTYKEYKGKPYYSIKYIESGETYVGYGTYSPKVLSRYLRECFMVTAQPELSQVARDIATIIENEHDMRVMLSQPEIVRCKDCVHHIDGFFCRRANHHTSDKDHCASVFGAERRTDE